MKDYEALAEAIVKQQESIVGPLAWTEAAKVSTLAVEGEKIGIKGDGTEALKALVSQYENLFGQASVEACKDAIRPLLPQMKDVKIPDILS